MAIKEAAFQYAENIKLGEFNYDILRKAGETKLLADINTLWEKSAKAVSRWNADRLKQLDELIYEQNDQTRKASNKLDKANERASVKKLAAINSDVAVSESYNLLQRVRNSSLPRFSTPEERQTKRDAVKQAELEHKNALQTQDAENASFASMAKAAADAANAFKIELSRLHDLLDEHFKLSGGAVVHECEYRKDTSRFVNQISGLGL